MQKILDFIQFGQGTGKRYLFWLAVLLGAFFSFFQYYQMQRNLEMPAVQAFLENLPTIEIKDGALISPANSYQIITFEDGQNRFTLTLDTRIDNFTDLTQLKNGFYLTKKAFYYVQGDSVTVDSLEKAKDIKIGQGDYLSFFKNIIRNTSLLMAPIAMFGAFVFLYLMTFIYGFASFASTMFMDSFAMSFDMRRRASVMAMLFGYILLVPLSFVHIFVGAGSFFVFVFVVESWFLYEISKRNVISIDNIDII
ncbi:MAG: DUF1189 family protein [Alphaproteobacteria bacterium]|jgi:hypothetical protein|nr:DUF1189 family protein [Alphaproteobacteria bacterium]